MRIYKEENSRDKFSNIFKELMTLTKKLCSYCTSDEAYNSLQNNMNREGR